MLKGTSLLILGLYISTSIQAAITITPADIQQDAEGYYYLYELTFGDLIRGSTKFEDDASNISNITIHKTPFAIPPATPDPRWVCVTTGEKTASFNYIFDFSGVSLNGYDTVITSVEIRDKLYAGNNKELSEDSAITSKWIVVGTYWHTLNSISSPQSMIPETSVQSHTVNFSDAEGIQAFYYQVEFECFDKDGFDENLNQWNHLSDSDNDHFYVKICLKEDLFSGGSGTEEDPYLIRTPSDLIYLGQHPEFYDANFLMINDIDMAGYSFTEAVIAPDTDPNDLAFNGSFFTGNFDGGDYAIKSLSVYNPSASRLGLFGITSDAHLVNIVLMDPDVIGESLIGGLVAGAVGGEILNCHVKELISNASSVAGNNSIGGLVGFAGGCRIKDCTAYCSVEGNDNVGGLVGSVYLQYIDTGMTSHRYGEVISCHSISSVTGSDYVGGLIGLSGGVNNQNKIITDCFAEGSVYGQSCVGGLIGSGSGEICDCYSTASVIGGSSYTGGLIGNAASCEINNCYSVSIVTGQENTGGLIGICQSTNILKSYSESTVNGGYATGGLVGRCVSSCQISYCYSSGIISGAGYSIGGFVGANISPCLINSCYTVAQLETTGSSFYVGGFAGYNSGALIHCYSSTYIDCQGACSCIGGLIGKDYNSDGSTAYYTSCFWDIEASYLADGVGESDGDDDGDDPDPAGVYGRYTSTMKNLQLYLPYFWDFVGEDFNGYDDNWRMCANGITYPKLWWEFTDGDIGCPDGVNLTDYSVLAKKWLTNETDLLWYDNADINSDGIIDVLDLLIMCENWLLGIE